MSPRGDYFRQRNWRHGHAQRGRASIEYRVWLSVRARCSNPRNISYPYYGGRGVTMLAEWRESFPKFLAGVGAAPADDHSLDRIDPNGNYEPGNVRWILRRHQNRTKRSNVRLTIDGVTRCVAEWAEISGVSHWTIYKRVKAGWNAVDAVFRQPTRANCVRRHKAKE